MLCRRSWPEYLIHRAGAQEMSERAREMSPSPGPGECAGLEHCICAPGSGAGYHHSSGSALILSSSSSFFFWRKSYLLLRKLLLNKRLFVSKDGLVLDHFLLSECRYSLPFYCFGFLSERSYSEPRSYLFGNLVGEIICGRGVTPRGQGNCHRHGYSRIRI